MYRPDSLDQERASWRTVVYFNIARSVKRILESLESYGDIFDENAPDIIGDPAYNSVSSKRALQETIRLDVVEDPQTSRSFPSPVMSEAQKQIANLRLRLSPLVSAEGTLADRLSGGVRVSGSGRGGVFVRHGWQTRSTARNGSSTSRSRDVLGASYALASPLTEGVNLSNVAEVVEEVGRILDASKEDIRALWRSDVVQKMIKRRRLRLEEWAELYVSIARASCFDTIC
jgi:guanine nucleotide-binding protein alpha-1 subunit